MYLKKATLMDEYEISLGTVDARLKFIRKHIGERYPQDAVCTTGRIVRIRDDVFKDAMLYGDAIERNLAPPFKPGEKHSWMPA